MDQTTSDFYRRRGEEWAASLPFEWSPELDPFLDRLAPGARILELGCGDGRDAERMIARGFDVHPSDGVREMAQMASDRLNRKVAILPFDQLEARQAYDAVWAHASLLHEDQAKLPSVLRRVYQALRPGGWHFANYKGGTGGHRDPHGRYYNYIPEEELRAAYAGAGKWSSVEIRSAAGKGFQGEQVNWITVHAQR